MPLGEFLDEQIARVIQHDVVESDDELETETPETPARTGLPRYELPKVPEVMRTSIQLLHPQPLLLYILDQLLELVHAN